MKRTSLLSYVEADGKGYPSIIDLPTLNYEPAEKEMLLAYLSASTHYRLNWPKIITEPDAFTQEQIHRDPKDIFAWFTMGNGLGL